MHDNFAIEPMSRDFLLWRCLHGGPLTRESIERWEPDSRMPWPALRARNLPLLERLTEVYGACAIVAREGDRLVGMLRFYPKAVCDLPGAGQLCLQQEYPFGPAQGFAGAALPPIKELADRTLVVHCLMTGSPQCKENPYPRRGVGTRLVRALAEWAGRNGWAAIEATAYEEIPILYAISGQAGRAFWEKLGFRVVETRVEPEFEKENDFARTVREQAAARGIDPEAAKQAYTVRMDVSGS